MPDIEYSFGTGASAPNVHHSEADVDVNHDGVADGVALDFDGDGRVDDVMWDSDGDGVADTALLDENDDGVAEDAYSDPTGAGTWNAHGQGGGHAQNAPEPSPGPTDPQPDGGDDTDNGYEPYGTGAGDDHGGGEVPADLPDDGADHDDNSTPELPDTGGDDSDSDDAGSDDAGSDYEPRDDEDGDTTPLFDGLEDAPDVDREAVSGWYDDMMN